MVREIWGDVGRYRGRRRHPRGLARGGQLILDQLGCVVVLAADGERLAPLELAQLHAHRAELVDAHLAGRCGEMRRDVGRCGQMRADVGRCGEMWGDLGSWSMRTLMRLASSYSSATTARCLSTASSWCGLGLALGLGPGLG